MNHKIIETIAKFHITNESQNNNPLQDFQYEKLQENQKIIEHLSSLHNFLFLDIKENPQNINNQYIKYKKLLSVIKVETYFQILKTE